MTRKKTHKGKESMPSVAKKLVVVQSNEPTPEAATPIGPYRQRGRRDRWIGGRTKEAVP